jgi:hypothetical protein
VFIKYDESVKAFFGRELFNDGKILWAGYNSTPLVTETEDWDEIIVVKYVSPNEEKKATERLAGETLIKKSKVVSVNLMSQANLTKINAILNAYSKDSIDMTQSDRWKNPIGSPNSPSAEQVNLIKQKYTKIPIAIVNMMKYKDIAVYPEDYKGKTGKRGKIFTGREAYERYANKSMKKMGKSGGQIIALGNFDTVAAGDEDTDWDTFTNVLYPSFEVFIETFNVEDFESELIDRDAGLEKSKISVASTYEEFL